jgi:hypothetical protein
MVGSDYVQACAVHLQPRLADFLNLAAKQLGHEAKENVSVANNACWAIGEVAVKVLLSDLTCIFALSKVVSICAACHVVHSFCQPKLLLLHFGANFVVDKCLAGQTRYCSNCCECDFVSGSHPLQH